jgi:hypothetical protein
MTQDETLDMVSDGLSEGLACLTVMAGGIQAEPTWPAKLEAMERALEAIRAGVVQTNIPVHDHDLATLRRIRPMVDDWLATGQRHEGAAALAGFLYRSLAGATASVLEHSAVFTPADGSPRRGVTLRIGMCGPTAKRGPRGWTSSASATHSRCGFKASIGRRRSSSRRSTSTSCSKGRSTAQGAARSTRRGIHGESGEPRCVCGASATCRTWHAIAGLSAEKIMARSCSARPIVRAMWRSSF